MKQIHSYNPSQFSISTGNPLAEISQYDVRSVCIKDDWKVNQKLSLSYGLRYENQTNISDSLNFAPRFGFAFSPGAGGAKPPKTVFRGGLGVFYTSVLGKSSDASSADDWTVCNSRVTSSEVTMPHF